jgi:hypothetical protein
VEVVGKLFRQRYNGLNVSENGGFGEFNRSLYCVEMF